VTPPMAPGDNATAKTGRCIPSPEPEPSVMPSGELLRHGADVSDHPQLRDLDVLSPRRPRPHRKEDEQQPVSTSWSTPTG
jgi:hypothetical protein